MDLKGRVVTMQGEWKEIKVKRTGEEGLMWKKEVGPEGVGRQGREKSRNKGEEEEKGEISPDGHF